MNRFVLVVAVMAYASVADNGILVVSIDVRALNGGVGRQKSCVNSDQSVKIRINRHQV